MPAELNDCGESARSEHKCSSLASNGKEPATHPGKSIKLKETAYGKAALAADSVLLLAC